MPTRSAKEPLKPGGDDLTDRLIARFRDLVADGVFVPASKLPPERTLAERFGVNRSSLRHALTALEIMGIVTRRVGDGTYLSADSRLFLNAPMEFLVLVEGISFQDLMEARIIIEPALASRAAMRADAAQTAAIREALESMERSGGEVPKLVEADVRFHEAVAVASGNMTCRRMFVAIHKTLRQLIAQNAQGEPYKQKVEHHRRIYAAIRSRDPELAAKRMCSHLEHSLAMFVRQAQKRSQRARKDALSEQLRPINQSSPISQQLRTRNSIT